MSHAEKGGGGGGNIVGPLADAMDPMRPLKAMEKAGMDEALGILSIFPGAVGLPQIIDKYVPDPFSGKKGGGGAKPKAGGDHHGGGH